MRCHDLAGTLVLALLAVGATPVASQGADLFCVRVSEDVNPDRLNRQIVRGRVTVRVVPMSECAPTAASDSSATAGTSFEDYAAHVTGSSTELADLSGKVSASGQVPERDEMGLALHSLVALAEAELAWLDSHPPLECYRATHDEWREIMVALQAAAGTGERGVSNLDAGLVDEGARAITRVGRLAGDATDRLMIVGC